MAAIHPYHSVRLPWRNADRREAGLVGLELEVNNPQGNWRGADALTMFATNGHPHPIAEIDGSISRDTGFEIICPPLPEDQVVGENSYIANLITALVDTGTESKPPNGRHGMHINFSLTGWQEAHKNAVTHLLNYMVPVTAAVCQRSSGFGNFVLGRGIAPRRALRQAPDGVEYSLSFDPTPNTKYSAAWIRTGGNVMEFRAPLAMLDQGHINKCVRYVRVVHQWVQSMPGNNSRMLPFLTGTFSSAGTGRLTSAHLVIGSFAKFCDEQGEEMLAGIARASVPKKYHNLSSDPVSEILNSLSKFEGIENRLSYGVLYGNSDYAKQALRICEGIGAGVGMQAIISNRRPYPAAEGIEFTA